jgi:hypothetical protein
VADLFGARFSKGLSAASRSLISASIRPQSQQQYRRQWTRWRQWCQQQRPIVSKDSPAVADVINYLSHLFENEGLRSTTIRTYRAAIGQLVSPAVRLQLEQSDDLRRVLKGMEAVRPPRVPAPVWCRDSVLEKLASVHCSDSVYEVGRKLALLFLLYSGRRVHDLSLLRIDRSSLQLSSDRVHLQPAFGSKTDGSNFCQSAWGFTAAAAAAICPVQQLQRYLQLTPAAERRGQQALFIDPRHRDQAASVKLLRSWVKSLLELCEVSAPPGSTRSATATATASSLDGCNLDVVLQQGNWRSASSFIKHYFRPPQLRR